MSRAFAVMGAAAIAAVGVTVPTNAATKHSASMLCVGGSGCYSTVQAALDASSDGDTIKLNPGTFTGGVTIAKSVNLVGAGAGRTTIKGGGPVVTIFRDTDPAGLRVSIWGVTITGGLTQTGHLGSDVASWFAGGGGVFIRSADDGSPGASVAISDSVIRGNRVEPTSTTEFNGQPSVAFAVGGGILDEGRLTLVRSIIADNRSGGPVASGSGGGGIEAWKSGSLTMKDTLVTGNGASAVAPNGRGASGGGIETGDGETVSVSRSVLSNNTASLVSSQSVGNSDSAAGGGLNVSGGAPTTIDATVFTGNTASAIDPNGDPLAFGAALLVGSNTGLVLSHSAFTNNHTVANVLTEDPSSDHCCSGDIVEIDGGGTVSGTRIANNTNTLTTQSGTALLVGTFGSVNSDPQPLTISGSVIEGNSNVATNLNGPAVVDGGGVLNLGLMVIRDGTRIAGNMARANGTSGSAQGGGIWNGNLLGSNADLTLDGVTVTGNVLSGAPGVTLQGGGVFTSNPLNKTNTLIKGNSPDQCFGC